MGVARTTPDTIILTVTVPADAKVVVNGHETTSTGVLRQFVTKKLKPGEVYKYQVKTEFVRDGKTVSEEKSIQLTGGQTGELDFDIHQLADLPMPGQR